MEASEVLSVIISSFGCEIRPGVRHVASGRLVTSALIPRFGGLFLNGCSKNLWVERTGTRKFLTDQPRVGSITRVQATTRLVQSGLMLARHVSK